jgi:hypothetical protein
MSNDAVVIVPLEFVPFFLIPMIVFFYMMRSLEYSFSAILTAYVLLQIAICIVARLLYS